MKMNGAASDAALYVHIYTHIHIYIYIYNMYICICICTYTRTYSCAYVFMQRGASWLTFLLGRGVCIGLVPRRVRKAKLITSSSDVTGL